MFIPETDLGKRLYEECGKMIRGQRALQSAAGLRSSEDLGDENLIRDLVREMGDNHPDLVKIRQAYSSNGLLEVLLRWES